MLGEARRFATIAQSARLVPVIEPEILTTGEHEMPRALEVHEEVLSALFRAMVEHHVFLEGLILTPVMVLAGIQNVKFCKPQVRQRDRKREAEREKDKIIF